MSPDQQETHSTNSFIVRVHGLTGLSRKEKGATGILGADPETLKRGAEPTILEGQGWGGGEM